MIGINHNLVRLQSYILSTTTETTQIKRQLHKPLRFNRTSFQQQLKPQGHDSEQLKNARFNRTSFQQQLKHVSREAIVANGRASIVHPFNNN